MAVFSPLSKSTNVSAGQSFCCSSSRGTCLARVRDEFDQNAKRLLLQLDAYAVLAQLSLALGTKLVDPDVTSAFEPGSGNRFTPQQCIPDQLGIRLGVDYGLQEFSSQPDRKILQHLFQQAMWDASGMQTELLG